MLLTTETIYSRSWSLYKNKEKKIAYHIVLSQSDRYVKSVIGANTIWYWK